MAGEEIGSFNKFCIFMETAGASSRAKVKREFIG